MRRDAAVLEEFSGQRWFRLAVSGLDVRFFLRGPMLDAGGGGGAGSRAALSPLLGVLSESSRLIAPSQVHGKTILEASAENLINAKNIEADGILFDAREAGRLGLEASLRFADCAPVVVAPSREWVELAGAPWVLMMHSGYKGTVLNITGAGLEKVRARYGASALDGAWAWVGPCIGGANYPRSADEWTLRGLKAFRETNVKNEGEKIFFDIAGELRLQLTDAGINENSVFLSGIDTYERADLCYSYRNGERELRMFLWANPACDTAFANSLPMSVHL
ncbi:MAG: autotransporter adhesin family protein [Synergistaceae bacterium]|nr:autotransporter adhesin family protein [Synergistaceae bacterium]